MNTVTRTERGWAGHFIEGYRCLFRRNTLLECGKIKVVVSTVGAYRNPQTYRIETIGCERHYETMAFHATFEDPYWEADVHREVSFDSPWQLHYPDIFPAGVDNIANDMHEAVVAELTSKLSSGTPL